MLKWLFILFFPLNFLWADTLPPAKKIIPTPKLSPYQVLIDFYNREWVCYTNPQSYTFWKSNTILPNVNRPVASGYCTNYFRMDFDHKFSRFEADVCLFNSEQVYQRLSGSCRRDISNFLFNFDTTAKCYLSSKPIEIAGKSKDSSYYILPIETDSFVVTANDKSQTIVPKDTFFYYRKVLDYKKWQILTETFISGERDYKQEAKLMFVQNANLMNCNFCLTYNDIYDSNYIKIKSFLYQTTDTNTTIRIFAKNRVSDVFTLPKNGQFVINFHYNPVQRATQRTANLYYHENQIRHYIQYYQPIYFDERHLYYKTETILQLKDWDFLLPNIGTEIHLYGIDYEENLNNNPWYIRK